ncbi:MAG: S26 family signal peptidase [Labedaea sp.]
MTVLVGVGLVVLVAAVVGWRRYTVARVCGQSMSPTYVDGERVLALRRRHYRNGDVIVFRPAGQLVMRGDPAWRIKRVTAVAGDPVPEWLSGKETTVPRGHVVVVGDNARSQDSRQLGYVGTAHVAGVVVRRLG